MISYTSWHQCLFTVVLLVFFCTLIHIIVIQCLFIMLFSVCSYLLLFCAHCLHAQAVLFTHTLIRSLLTTLDLHVQILDALFLLCRCSMRLYAVRGAGRSPFWFWYSCIFIPAIILWFLYITLIFYFIPYFIWDHV